jgi:hypothetical protein
LQDPLNQKGSVGLVYGMSFKCGVLDPSNLLLNCECRQEDIMLLYDALKSLDPVLLTDVLLSEVEEWKTPFGSLEKNVQQSLVKRVSHSLNCVLSSSVNLSENTNKIIVPFQNFEQTKSGNYIKRKVRAGVVDSENLIQFMQQNACFDKRAPQDSQLCEKFSVFDQNVLQELKNYGAFDNVSVLSMFSIEDALGMRIWIPMELKAFEKYSVLANVFWMLTWLDVSYVQVDSTSNNLVDKQALYNIDEVRKFYKLKNEDIATYLTCNNLLSLINSVSKLDLSA